MNGNTNNVSQYSNPIPPFSALNSQSPQQQSNDDIDRPVRPRPEDSPSYNYSKRTSTSQKNASYSAGFTNQLKSSDQIYKNTAFQAVKSRNNKIRRGDRIKCIAALEQYSNCCKE